MQSVHVVVAVKELARAKSRLEIVPDRCRGRLVLAMLTDTLAAACRAAAVTGATVVTPDADVAAAASGLAAIVDDPGTGLNAALAHGARRVRELHGEVAVLALQADLPALRADELDAFVADAPANVRSLVVDHHGAGTTALLAPAGVDLDPRFGIDSARRHIESGAIALVGNWPGLRVDVDTRGDYHRARELGVGAATRSVMGEVHPLLRHC